MKNTLQITMQRFYEHKVSISITHFCGLEWLVQIGKNESGMGENFRCQTLDEVENFLSKFWWEHLYKEAE